MPYLHVDLRDLSSPSKTRNGETASQALRGNKERQLWRPNVGIAEFGKDNL
jgi:hypothetical protein